MSRSASRPHTSRLYWKLSPICTPPTKLLPGQLRMSNAVPPAVQLLHALVDSSPRFSPTYPPFHGVAPCADAAPAIDARERANNNRLASSAIICLPGRAAERCYLPGT